LETLQECLQRTDTSVYSDKNKNTFIAFLTFSDIYVCFTLSTLQTMVQHILDAGDIPVTTW
jgi:hypothetical protein